MQTTYKTIIRSLTFFGVEVNEVSHRCEWVGDFYETFFTVDGVEHCIKPLGSSEEEAVERNLEDALFCSREVVKKFLSLRKDKPVVKVHGPSQGPQRELMSLMLQSQNLIDVIDDIGINVIECPVSGSYNLRFETNIGNFFDNHNSFPTEIEALDALYNRRLHRGFVGRFKNWFNKTFNSTVTYTLVGVEKEEEEVAQEALQELEVVIPAQPHAEPQTIQPEAVQELTMEDTGYTFSSLAKNTLMSKIFKEAGGFDFEQELVNVSYDDSEHKLVLSWKGVKFDIIKLDAGVSPDKWAVDGRRNWRPIKRLISNLVSEKKRVQMGFIFEEVTEFSLLGHIQEIEWAVNEYPSTILKLEELTDPFESLELAVELDPTHPLLTRYEEVRGDLFNLISLPNHEADRDAAQLELDARLEKEKQERRARYVIDRDYRNQQDAEHARWNSGPFSMTDDFEDLREVLKPI